MMPPDIESEIVRLFHAERWKVGTIAAQLGPAPFRRRSRDQQQWNTAATDDATVDDHRLSSLHSRGPRKVPAIDRLQQQQEPPYAIAVPSQSIVAGARNKKTVARELGKLLDRGTRMEDILVYRREDVTATISHIVRL